MTGVRQGNGVRRCSARSCVGAAAAGAEPCVRHRQGQGGVLETGLRAGGQLHVAALIRTSDSILLLGDSAHSQRWERDFFPVGDRQTSQRASKGQSAHTEQLPPGIMETQRQRIPSRSYFTSSYKLQSNFSVQMRQSHATAVLRFRPACTHSAVPASRGCCAAWAVLIEKDIQADWGVLCREVLRPWPRGQQGVGAIQGAAPLQGAAFC